MQPIAPTVEAASEYSVRPPIHMGCSFTTVFGLTVSAIELSSGVFTSISHEEG